MSHFWRKPIILGFMVVVDAQQEKLVKVWIIENAKFYRKNTILYTFIYIFYSKKNAGFQNHYVVQKFSIFVVEIWGPVKRKCKLFNWYLTVMVQITKSKQWWVTTTCMRYKKFSLNLVTEIRSLHAKNKGLVKYNCG